MFINIHTYFLLTPLPQPASLLTDARRIKRPCPRGGISLKVTTGTPFEAADPRYLRRVVRKLNLGPPFGLVQHVQAGHLRCVRARLHRGNFQVREEATGLWRTTSVLDLFYF